MWKVGANSAHIDKKLLMFKEEGRRKNTCCAFSAFYLLPFFFQHRLEKDVVSTFHEPISYDKNSP
jgi:hypothetical protein